jgi:rhodanese-related sulfurtransferase
MQTIQSRELDRQLGSGSAPMLLDVRTPVEHEEVHLDGARLMPLDELDPQRVRDSLTPGGSCVVICGSGGRAARAAQSLRDAGCGDVRVLEGGMNAWQEAGLPVIRSARRRLPLMRQVQLVIGSVVLAGTVGSLYVDPRLLWLAVFMGAGLVFAGASGWCGLAILLSKMPWNRSSCGCANSCAR